MAGHGGQRAGPDAVRQPDRAADDRAGPRPIINLNSLAGVDARTAGTGSAYGVSKAALFRLTDVLAAEVAGTGVVVLDISPGLARTSMTDDAPAFGSLPELRKAIA